MILGLGVAAFLVTAVVGLLIHATTDEAWMLVVARRALHGERPYRDFFFGAGPLALWLLRGAFWLTRPQGLVLRAVGAAYVGAEAALLAALVEISDAPSVAAPAAVAALLALGGFHLHPNNHYAQLTDTAVLAAAAAILASNPLPAGIMAGVAVLGKYPQGLLAVAGTALVAAAVDGASAAGLVVAGAAGVVAVAATVLGTDLTWFYRRAVANKGDYWRSGRVTPAMMIRMARWRPWPAAVQWSLMLAAAGALVASPPVAVATAFMSGEGRIPAVATLLGVTAVAAAVPRFDGAHAVASFPLAAGSLLLSGIAAGVGRTWWGTIAAASVVALLVGVVARVKRTLDLPRRRNVPSLRGLPVRQLGGGVWPDETSELPARVFLVRPDAPLLYACGGISNPTPFDYPMASTFGPHGQGEAIRAIATGAAACVRWPDSGGMLAPKELLRYLGDLPGTDTRIGRLIRTGVPPS